MNLKSGFPYFLIKDGLQGSFGQLENDSGCDVAIVGGGISGALVASELTTRGIECILVDRRGIGLGSTCASTSLLQYELDVPLHQLEKMIGKEPAVKAYRMCVDAIASIITLANSIGFTEIQSCSSIYFAHRRSMNKYLEREYHSRTQAGIEVELLSGEQLKAAYGFDSSSALYSKVAARMDAYLFTHSLIRHSQQRGLRVYDNTCIDDVRHEHQQVNLITSNGKMIKAKRLVYATGYEAQEQISKNMISFQSTFASASYPLSNLPDYFRNTLFWNTASPYLYIREDSGRLIIGGRDIPGFDAYRKSDILQRKTDQLKNDFEDLFSDIKFEPQFSWTGAFGYSKDGLPYIGEVEKHPGTYYALGYGGNGIVFSFIAARLIADHITGKSTRMDPLFGFQRK